MELPIFILQPGTFLQTANQLPYPKIWIAEKIKK